MKSAFPFGLGILSLAVSSSLYADTADYRLDPIIVTATRVAMPDTDAPYTSEVHTRKMIEASAATTVYEYLSQETGLAVMPSYGNTFAPMLDMRGYGLGNGYQNIAVTVDGRRMNNIDMAAPLLGSIPLADIERIEITRGSGSVMFGDGATAGSIQIYTRPKTGMAASIMTGGYGFNAASLTGGMGGEKVSFSVGAEQSDANGFRAPDATGFRDSSSMNEQRAQVKMNVTDALKVNLSGSSAHIDTRYGGYVTLAQYNTDPAQNNGKTYTHQIFESDVWGLGLDYQINQALSLAVKHNQEDKLSNYVAYSSVSRYDYTSDDAALRYQAGNLNVVLGTQVFDGIRLSSSNRTSKKNTGWYLQGQYRIERVTLSAGAREEEVEYAYIPNSGTALNSTKRLSAADVGINYRYSPTTSVFANYNLAFEAPDIDRFFNYGGTFNGFIQPAQSRTLNFGANYVNGGHRLKATVFRANLNNEIYYYNTGSYFTSYNTNLDKTHKYGLELQDTWRVNSRLSAEAMYSYTRAIIDSEDMAGGAYNGKELPGVSRNAVKLGLNYAIDSASSVNLSHVWRSEAWAANDFGNSFSQKQAAYQSTSLAYRYRVKNMEWFAAIDNLFDQKNGVWVSDNVIYPVNFTRTWKAGLKVNF